MKKLLFGSLFALAGIAIVMFFCGRFDYFIGSTLAKYDLYKNKPKYYVYGLVERKAVTDKFSSLRIEAVTPGCIVGEGDYEIHMAYNGEIRKHFPIIEKF